MCVTTKATCISFFTGSNSNENFILLWQTWFRFVSIQLLRFNLCSLCLILFNMKWRSRETKRSCCRFSIICFPGFSAISDPQVNIGQLIVCLFEGLSSANENTETYQHHLNCSSDSQKYSNQMYLREELCYFLKLADQTSAGSDVEIAVVKYLH